MPAGGAEAITGLQRSKYCYTGDDNVVYYISMRDAYAAENGMVLVGAGGAPAVTGGKFPGKPRHVWLLAPAPLVINHATKSLRRKMPFDVAATRAYLNGKKIGDLTTQPIDGLIFEIEGHTGEKTHA